jgi:hypothetical protein
VQYILNTYIYTSLTYATDVCNRCMQQMYATDVCNRCTQQMYATDVCNRDELSYFYMYLYIYID